MNLLDRILQPLGYAKAERPKPPPAQLLALADGQRWDMPEATEAEKQMRLYAMLTWISTAIDRTAEIAAGGVFSVRQVAGEPGGPDDEEIPNHEFELRLRRPNPSQSRGEFLRDCFTMYRVTGNLYIFLNKPSEFAPPDELWIVPSHLIKPIPDGRSYIAGYEYTPPGKTPQFVDAWRILHLKTANPYNPFVGLSAIQSLALDAYGDLAQQKWNAKLFDKDNGKLPVILAFKDMVGDPQWNEIKRQREQEWGGTNRPGVMLLRGVGDSLTLLQAGASQKEMEFLAGRQFTKEEIYGKLAPGLASILAVNATEANAIAGKATLIEFGVWPVLVQLAEKFTADILPLYGENLIGEFEDMRQTNRILDLQEQQEYAKYHTVNEVRAEYYDEGPLMLTKGQAKAEAENEAEEQERKETALAQLNAAPKPASAVPAKADALPADGQPSEELDPRGFMFAAQIGPNTPMPGEKKPAPVVAPPGQPPMMQAEGDAVPDKEGADDGQAAEREMKAWEVFAVKRLGRGGRDFEPRVLPLMQAARIRAALKAAQTEADVRRVFARERGGGDGLAEAVAELRRFNDIARPR